MDQVYQNQQSSVNSEFLPQKNVFANDGSFMDMFKNLKKQMEAVKHATSPCERDGDESQEDPLPPPTTSGAVSVSSTADDNGPTQKFKSHSQNESNKTENEAHSNLTTTSDVQPQPPAKASFPVKKQAPIIGKRRGKAPALKTGTVVKKVKQEHEETAQGRDAWSMYMAEVKRYTGNMCHADDQSRPLLK